METKGLTLVTGNCHKLKVRSQTNEGWYYVLCCGVAAEAAFSLGISKMCLFLYLRQKFNNNMLYIMFGFPLVMLVALFFFISGRVAALNMLKKPTKIESVPFFWTVLLGKSIRYTGRGFTQIIPVLLKETEVLTALNLTFSFRFLCVGHGEGYTEIIFKGKVEERKFLAFYIK